MARKFVFDAFQPGFRKMLREHEEVALRFFWDEKAENVSSGDVLLYVNKKLEGGKSISRTTISNFLQDMADEGVLNPRRVSGKGGHYNIYTQKLNEKEYIKQVIRTLFDSLMRDFPEETKEILRDMISE